MGMNNLKWYDFIGALVLLFAVTKSAIKPPSVTNHPTIPALPSDTKTMTMDAQKIAPRQAALAQMDLLTPSTNGSFIGNVVIPGVQAGSTGARLGSKASDHGRSTVKTLPKVPMRVERHIDHDVGNVVGLQSPASSFAPALIW
jgi:hypothetical protein